MARLRRAWRSPAGLVVKIAVALSILAWFALTIDLPRLARVAAGLRPGYLVVLAALSLVRIAIAARRFSYLSSLRVVIPFRSLVEQQLVGAFFNNLLPTSLGGDAVRLFMLARAGLPKQEGAVFILAERSIGVAALLILAVLGVLSFDAPASIDVLVGLLAGLTLLAAILALSARRRLEAQAERRPAIARALRAAALLGRSPGALLLVLASSLLFQLISITLSWVTAKAFGLELPFAACLALVPLVWLATMLPISIGGLGLRELAFTQLLGTIGMSTEASLIVSFGTFAALALSGGLGGLIVLRSSLRSAWAERPPDAD